MSKFEERMGVAGEDGYRDLVICNDCLWAVSLLRIMPKFSNCPICKSKNLEVIPVTNQESYTMRIKEKRGIEIEFAR
jgi:hypothetical protein